MDILILTLQIIIALGIYNVWLIRFNMNTPYRGKGASNMKKEFKAYGLSVNFMYFIGTLKILLATALLVGIWEPAIVQPAAVGIAILMVGAIVMHIKAQDSFKRIIPALLMLSMSLIITFV